ncbi:hypothetical protein CYMTET_15892 [Cymbomonas tetramitiformis]|uniref:Uncharacterized protein n=1 Tax=Cymbomonas tetramitiformis TaxID=36881 RepID=A0AAE0GDI6_9CHLO|nr:hypothetical protein CYMTET_15892 [Cymbomonas tetramitiformis]
MHDSRLKPHSHDSSRTLTTCGCFAVRRANTDLGSRRRFSPELGRPASQKAKGFAEEGTERIKTAIRLLGETVAVYTRFRVRYSELSLQSSPGPPTFYDLRVSGERPCEARPGRFISLQASRPGSVDARHAYAGLCGCPTRVCRALWMPAPRTPGSVDARHAHAGLCGCPPRARRARWMRATCTPRATLRPSRPSGMHLLMATPHP